MAKRFITILCILLAGFTPRAVQAQAPDKWTSAEIHEAIQKLNKHIKDA